MKLIKELTESVQILTESENGKKKYYFEGILLQGDIQNKNGRVYPFNVLQKEVSRYIRENINQGRAYGECGHPSGPEINLERVSHLFVEMKPIDRNFYGKARVLDTPFGQIVRGLLDGGAKLGTSSRGLGSLKEQNGINYVQEDFRLATAGDIVADPSAPDAFVEGIMEGVEWIYENGHWSQKSLENLHKEIKNTPKRRLEKAKFDAFIKFMKNI